MHHDGMHGMASHGMAYQLHYLYMGCVRVFLTHCRFLSCMAHKQCGVRSAESFPYLIGIIVYFYTQS